MRSVNILLSPGSLVAFLGCLACMSISVASSPNFIGVLGAALCLLMFSIAVIDWRKFLIPDKLIAAALLLGVLHAAADAPESAASSVAGGLMRGLTLGLLFAALRELYFRYRGREGLGFGDVKLAGVAGLWLGGDRKSVV